MNEPDVLSMVELFYFLLDSDINEAVVVLNNIIQTAASKMKSNAVKFKNAKKLNQPAWWNSESEALKQEKYFALNKFRRTNDAVDFMNYIHLRKAFKENCRINIEQLKAKTEQELMDVKHSPQLFWKKIKHFISNTQTNSKIEPEAWTAHFSNLYTGTSDELMSEFERSVQVDILAHDESCQQCRENLYCAQNVNLDVLNEKITETDIDEAINCMSNNKAPGLDGIPIEQIKANKSFYIPMFEKLFNQILDTGIFPEEWSKAIICPIHKKGSTNEPKNYRGISLLCTMSKIFTKILNVRLNSWAEEENIRHEEQAGFRKGYSTADQVFNLQCLIQKYISKKKGRCYILFLDFETAFDRVPHSLLFYKLMKTGLHGKMFTVIRSMYAGMKSLIRTKLGLTDFIECLSGTRQGCRVSPFYSLCILENSLKCWIWLNARVSTSMKLLQI